MRSVFCRARAGPLPPVRWAHPVPFLIDSRSCFVKWHLDYKRPMLPLARRHRIATGRIVAAHSPPLLPSPARAISLPVGWPLAALLVLYPVWWVLGLGPFIFVILSIPMAWQMWRYGWTRLPPGFSAWMLLLIWVVASGVMLNATAPDTLPPEGFGRFIAFGMRLANYVAITVIFLYVGNLPRDLVSTLRIARWLAILFISTVVGGFLGLLLPNISFSSPMKYLLPAALADNDFVAGVLTPSFAQVQDIIGNSNPRPSAPFDYTNLWGNNLAILLVWFVIAWWVFGTSRQRRLVPFVLLASLIPLVYSLNRGVWAGIVLAAAYTALRLTANGRWKVVVAGLLATLMAVPVLAFTPLSSVLSARIENPHSNDVRGSLASQSFDVAMSSPVLGYGSTRKTIGSERSLTIGRTPDCPQCGNRVLGSTGQIWLVLISQGPVGAAFYVSFFAYSLWRYRKDSSAVGIGGSAVIVMSFLFMFFYTAIVSPLALTLISVAMLWRNDRDRADERRPSTISEVAAGAPR